MIYNQVINNLQKLKLDKISSNLSVYLDEINKNIVKPKNTHTKFSNKLTI